MRKCRLQYILPFLECLIAVSGIYPNLSKEPGILPEVVRGEKDGGKHLVADEEMVDVRFCRLVGTRAGDALAVRVEWGKVVEKDGFLHAESLCGAIKPRYYSHSIFGGGRGVGGFKNVKAHSGKVDYLFGGDSAAEAADCVWKR